MARKKDMAPWEEPAPAVVSVKELKEFVVTVAAMRDAQRQYFRTREPAFLQEAIRLEKEVDRKVQEWVGKWSPADGEG